MSESKISRSKSSTSWRTLANAQPQTNNPKSRSAPRSSKPSGYRVGAYIRLSPSDEIREEGSLVSHPQRLKDWVRMKNTEKPGWGQIVEIYTDKDFSGKDMNRPGFRAMCKDIQEGNINAVLAVDLSRLSRSAKDFLQFRDFLKQNNVDLFILNITFDINSPHGELILLQFAGFAQFEREMIVSRIRDGARARALRGLANGGQRPLGYDPDPSRKCYLKVNVDERPIVQSIFAKFLELRTLANLQNYLNKNGYRTKEYVTNAGKKVGGKPWTIGSIYNLLTNLIYVGKREINKKNRSKSPDDCPKGQEYKVVDAHWPAIVTMETFNAVQSLLETNRKKTRRYVHCYRLSGLVSCGICTTPLVGKGGTGKNGRYFYYAHMRKMTLLDDRHLKKCTLEYIPAAPLEEAVISRLHVLSQDKQLLASILKKTKGSSQSQVEYLASLLASKEQEKRSTEKNLDALLGLATEAKSEASRQTLLKKVDDFTQRIESIRQDMDRLKSEKKNSQRNILNLEDDFSVMRVFNKEFHNQAPHIQQQLLKNAVHRVVVNTELTTAEYYASPQEEILPVVGVFEEDDNSAEHLRTGVRTLSKLVARLKQQAHLQISSVTIMTSFNFFQKRKIIFIRFVSLFMKKAALYAR